MELLERFIKQILSSNSKNESTWLKEKSESPKIKWNYMDGCMIKAILELYQITKNEYYLKFSDDYIDRFIQSDGSIFSYNPKEHNLDNVNAGKTLFDLYKLTGKEKYRKGIEVVYSQLKDQPRTSTGNFWHKEIYPNQIWLDGLYMAQPFYMQYEVEYNNNKHCLDIVNQFRNVYKIMRNEKNGLYYHAYDDSRQMFWCDKVTGLSDSFWLRALGWYAMALIDTIELTPKHLEAERNELIHIFEQLITAMLPYQDEQTGMWYQVVNLGGIKPNYLETSGSAIFAYVIMKGARVGILPDSYFLYGEKAFHGICKNHLLFEGDNLVLDGICLVAGLGNKEEREGTFEYYMREPIVQNEAKGIAPLLLAYTEFIKRNQ